MKKNDDLYSRVAEEENVSRNDVKTLAMPILYSTGFRGKNIEEVEQYLKQIIKYAKEIGLIHAQ